MADKSDTLRFRVRPRPDGRERSNRPGHVNFDDRGNAVYEWTNDGLLADGEEADRLRDRALDHPGLSLVDDEAPAGAPIRQNDKGLRVGYNPYESGVLNPSRDERKKKKTDLRELSKWIETKRRLERGE